VTRGLKPGDRAPDFTLPAADHEGSVSLADYHGRPLLLALMRGVHCPFCRRNISLFGAIAPKLQAVGVAMLAIVGTTAERARFYFCHRPAAIPLAADADLVTHRRYGIPCYPITPQVLEQYRTVRVDPFRELPAPVPFVDADGVEIHDVFDHLDGFVPTDVDQRDRMRQFRESVQVCGQYLLDGEGIVRFAHVEGEPDGLVTSGIFPSVDTLLAAARAL
jgi:peroxiredoxin